MQTSFAPNTSKLHCSRRQQHVAPRRSAVVTRAGLFDFLKPGKPATKPSNRSKELVDELLTISIPTKAGDKASDALREQIAELVDELEQYCPKNPLKSPLLWGDYEVVYAARPGTIAGPFKSPLGQVVFPGLESSQELIPPNVCINKAQFKTLGFIPGGVKQEGYFEPLDGNSFKLIFPQQDGKRPGGPRERLITISYLDDRMRVARFTPSEEDSNSQPTFYVFIRKGVQQQGVEGEGTGTTARGGRNFGTQLLGRKEGLATQVERSYYKKKGQGTGSTAGTARVGRTQAGTARKAAPAPAAAPAQTAAERAAAREAAAAERAEAKRRADEEKRAAAERQAAEREAQRKRAAAIKAQMAELSSEAQQAQRAAQEAAKAAKDFEREAAPLLRQAASARDTIEGTVGAAAAAAQRVQGIKEEEKAVGKEVEAAKKLVRQLEEAGKR